MRRAGLLDLNEAVQHPGRKLSVPVQTELAQEADLDLLEPVAGTVDAVSTGNLLLVHGRFKTRIVVECARCGAPIEQDLDFRMDDEFDVEGIPSAYASDGYAEVVFDEPDKLFDKNALVIDQYVRQGLLLSLPSQPLCSGSWDGPCANEEAVNAASGGILGNPAFEGLAKLRQEETA
jgi:uncharacterized metal-binding protein YceD (DUF177 family)